MAVSTIARIEALEAEAFRTQRTMKGVVNKLDYVANAVGDLSQDLRAVRHEQGEHGVRLTAIEVGLRQMNTAIVGMDSRLGQVESVVTTLNSRMGSLEEVIGAIAVTVGAK